MESSKFASRLVATLLVLSCVGRGLAECPAIDFEDFAVGTAITSQYPGVVFSVQPQSCGGSPTLYLRIATATGGTSSGTRALRIDTGCPDFSPDYLRIRFDDLQREVRFTVGEATGVAGYDFDIRYYSDSSLLGTLHIESANGVNRLVHIGSSGGAQNIRRVEVDSTIDAFEAIDDLTFNVDTTPPQVQIDQPLFEACVCGNYSIRGIACDSDGEYAGDTLEYLRVDAAPGTDWMLVSSATSPVCTSGPLYNWNTTGLAHGKYYLRVTATNACGLSASAVVVSYVDRQFDTVAMRFPAEGGIVGGSVCIDGTVWDHLCFDEYTVNYQPIAGGGWSPVDPGHSSYAATVVNDPVASWDTKDPLIADGGYRLRVLANDDCGNSGTVLHTVMIDNAPPVAIITSPLNCDYVNGVVRIMGTVNDAHLAGWSLSYTGGPAHDWAPIPTPSGPVIGGRLADWDTTGLSACTYTLRLVAEDAAVLDCNSASHNRTEYLVTVDLGDACDVNGDGVGNFFDIDPFLECLFQE